MLKHGSRERAVQNVTTWRTATELTNEMPGKLKRILISAGPLTLILKSP